MMNPLVAGLVLFPIFAVPALSQTTTSPQPQQPLAQIRQFLELTDAQVRAILQNNTDYNTFSSQQQRQIFNAQSQIAVETAKDQIDPMALGTLYAGIESARRELRDKAAASQQQNISVLTDAQKAKLNTLSDAMKLIPTASEAQFGNLLGPPNAPPYGFTSNSSTFGGVSYIGSPGLSGIYGCGVNGIPSLVVRSGDFSSALGVNGNTIQQGRNGGPSSEPAQEELFGVGISAFFPRPNKWFNTTGPSPHTTQPR